MVRIDHELNLYHGINLPDYVESLSDHCKEAGNHIKNYYVNYPHRKLRQSKDIQPDFYWNYRFTVVYIEKENQLDCYWLTEWVDSKSKPIIIEHIFNDVKFVAGFDKYLEDIYQFYRIWFNDNYGLKDLMRIDSQYLYFFKHILYQGLIITENELNLYFDNYYQHFTPHHEYPVFATIESNHSISNSNRILEYKIASFELSYINLFVQFKENDRFVVKIDVME